MKKILLVLLLLPSLCMSAEHNSAYDQVTSPAEKHLYRMPAPHGWMLHVHKTMYA